jgi:hypothetical protein
LRERKNWLSKRRMGYYLKVLLDMHVNRGEV